MKVWPLSTPRNAEILAESFSDYLQLCGLHCTFNLLAIGHLVCQCISCKLSAEEKVSTFFCETKLHFIFKSFLNWMFLYWYLQKYFHQQYRYTESFCGFGVCEVVFWIVSQNMYLMTTYSSSCFVNSWTSQFVSH